MISWYSTEYSQSTTFLCAALDHLNQYGKKTVNRTFGVTIFKSSRRNESRIFSCSAVRITVVIVAAVDGTSEDGDHTLPDSIFSSVGTIRLLQNEKTKKLNLVIE